MSSAYLLTLVFVLFVDARVYHLNDLSEGSPNVLPRVYDNFEQSSRDLDLTFSAGDGADDVEMLRPKKKVYTLVRPEIERPVAYYKLAELPERKDYVDGAILVPETNKKLLKIDGGNNKGEVILELRVIANHDSA